MRETHHGQHAENRIVLAKVQHFRHARRTLAGLLGARLLRLTQIRHNVRVRQSHALGQTRGARRKGQAAHGVGRAHRGQLRPMSDEREIRVENGVFRQNFLMCLRHSTRIAGSRPEKNCRSI